MGPTSTTPPHKFFVNHLFAHRQLSFARLPPRTISPSCPDHKQRWRSASSTPTRYVARPSRSRRAFDPRLLIVCAAPLLTLALRFRATPAPRPSALLRRPTASSSRRSRPTPPSPPRSSSRPTPSTRSRPSSAPMALSSPSALPLLSTVCGIFAFCLLDCPLPRSDGALGAQMPRTHPSTMMTETFQ